jgi:hypothetical protein
MVWKAVSRSVQGAPAAGVSDRTLAASGAD